MQSFDRLFEIIKRLRAPGGCPWDIEQTPQSLRGNLIEETYECVEAINDGEPGHVREELGDVFLQAVLLSYIYEQAGSFTLAEVLDGLSDKLIRRHPHVFGDVRVKDSAEVLRNWARIKVEQEGRRRKDSVLDEVSGSLPPLDRAYKLQKKAAKQGFDWDTRDGVFGKINEELGEVREVLANEGNPDSLAALEGELGDLLFSVVNLCRFLKVDVNVALQRTNVKFTERFKYVEKKMKEAGVPMEKGKLELMDKYWNEAKGPRGPFLSSKL
jgi:tetrapyrrole methylase family protein/MazG family protein